MEQSKRFLPNDYATWAGKLFANILSRQPVFTASSYHYSWLQINGEAIYGSRPWIYQNDTHTPDVWYTAHSGNIYAMILEYPYDTQSVTLYALSGHVSEMTTTVTILGCSEPVKVIDMKIHLIRQLL